MLMVLKKANCQTFLASSCYCYGLFFFVSFLFQQKVPAIHDSFIRTLLPKSTSSSLVGVETSLTLLIFIISLNCFITNYPTPAQTKLPFFLLPNTSTNTRTTTDNTYRCRSRRLLIFNHQRRTFARKICVCHCHEYR